MFTAVVAIEGNRLRNVVENNSRLPLAYKIWFEHTRLTMIVSVREGNFWTISLKIFLHFNEARK